MRYNEPVNALRAMTSSADHCWRLSGDCSRWAEESRDNATRLAFRQMAKVWARLAISDVFTTDELTDPASSESSDAKPATPYHD